ncbi:MAG: glycosyltransferase family 39 protein, partial [Candidatus Aminicenantes bacterium]|nr:glycosyltransferase family 39 protein [Candidatus Aminicenantes bacterium]
EAALIAGLAFALAPLPVRVSNALQPEGPMLFFYILAVWAFLRWLDRDSPGRFTLAVFATAAVILVKLPAAHIGFLLLFLLISRKGVKALREAQTWLFGCLSLIPGILWYVHAHTSWTRYGLSLGLSNETHWLGSDLLIHPRKLLTLLVSLVRLETLYVWMPLGILAAVWLLLRKKDSPAVTVSLFWLASIGLYYILAIRTLGDEWAVYYHVVTAPAAALLLGTAAAAVYERWTNRRAIHRAFLWTALPAAVLIAVRSPLNLAYPSNRLLIAAIAVFTAALTITILFSSRKKSEPLFSFKKLFVWALVPAVISTFLFSALRIGLDLHPTRFQGKYECALQFASLISGDPLLLVSGGVSRDDTDRPVAYNAPYFFYWLDKKGFNIPKDRLSLESVQDFAAKGAGFFILEKEAAGRAPGFLESLRAVYPQTAECGEAWLFDLRLN